MRKDNIYLSSESLNELQESFNNYLNFIHDDNDDESVKSRKVTTIKPYTVDERVRLARMQNVNSVAKKLENDQHFDLLQNKAMQLIYIMVVFSGLLGLVVFNIGDQKPKVTGTSIMKSQPEVYIRQGEIMSSPKFLKGDMPQISKKADKTSIMKGNIDNERRDFEEGITQSKTDLDMAQIAEKADKISIMKGNIDDRGDSEEGITQSKTNLEKRNVVEDTMTSKMPAFYEMFQKNTSGKHIPVLLDIPGSGTEGLPSAFVKCLGLSALMTNTAKVKHDTDFIVTQSLCNFGHRYEMNQTPQLAVILRDPLVRTIQLYKKLTLQNQASKKPEMSLDRFLKSNFFTDNSFTRALTCKPKGVLTDKDLETAKSILGKSVVATYDNMLNNVFIGAFTEKKDQIFTEKKCIKDNVMNKLQVEDSAKVFELLRNHDHVKEIRQKNKFDMKLYLYSLSLK